MSGPQAVPNPPHLQPWNPPQEAVPPAWIMAAKRGCALCLGRLRVPPAGPPFSQGPNVGRYLCADCWTLYWNEHPEHLADEETRRYVADEARRITLRRQAAVLFEEEGGRAYRTTRGTVVFEIKCPDGMAPNEFDAARLEVLAKAVEAVTKRMPIRMPSDAVRPAPAAAPRTVA